MGGEVIGPDSGSNLALLESCSLGEIPEGITASVALVGEAGPTPSHVSSSHTRFPQSTASRRALNPSNEAEDGLHICSMGNCAVVKRRKEFYCTDKGRSPRVATGEDSKLQSRHIESPHVFI